MEEDGEEKERRRKGRRERERSKADERERGRAGLFEGASWDGICQMSMTVVATMERTHMKYTPPPPRPRTLHAHTHKRLEATAFLAADYESGGSTLYSGVELSKVQRSHCYSGSETWERRRDGTQDGVFMGHSEGVRGGKREVRRNKTCYGVLWGKGRRMGWERYLEGI